MSDNFETVTELLLVSTYNIACCYSQLGKVDQGLDALKKVLLSGWSDYKKMRQDPSLEVVRASPEFNELMDQFDEPLINANAINFVKGLFGK